LRVQFCAIAQRAAASGCALDPVPVLILREENQHTSVTFAGRRDGNSPPRVCLAPDLMDTDTDPPTGPGPSPTS